MKNEKIVITGGAGFIGSHLADELARENEVTIMNYSRMGRTGHISDLIKTGKARLVEGNVTDRGLLKKVFNNKDIVFHLAAIASVVKSMEDYPRANDVNINGTLNVLMTARDEKLEKVVFASSSAVYGDAGAKPISEEVVPNPISTYGVAKLAGEHYCRIFHRSYGLPTVALRYFNVYGPRQDPDSPYAAAIPKFIRLGLEGKPIEIYGDGTQTRDFVYVKDVVRATISAAEEKKCEGEVINVGTGKGVSVNLLVGKVARILGKELDVRHLPPRKGDIKHSHADISKAGSLLRFKPKFTLEEGLSNTVEYMKGVGR